MKLSNGAAGLALILSITACGGSDDYKYTGGRSELDIKVGAQAAIKAKLRDPSSAEFSHLHISGKAGIDIVCGEVNSRNGFGGMDGAEQFISNGVNLAFLQSEVADGGWSEIWNRYC